MEQCFLKIHSPFKHKFADHVQYSNKKTSGSSSPNSDPNKEFADSRNRKHPSLNTITSFFRRRNSATATLETVEEPDLEEYPPHNFPAFTTVRLNGEFPVTAVTIKLHSAALISKSKFFADRLEQNFEKSKSYYDEKNYPDERKSHHDVINLNNVRLNIFKLFVQFVQNGQLTDVDLQILEDPRLTSEEKEESAVCKGKFAFGGKTHLGAGPEDVAIDRLINAYLLGERLQAPYFCNIMLEGLAEKYRDFFREHDSQIPLWNLEHAFSGQTYFGMPRFVADVVHFALSRRTLDFAFQKGLLDEGIREKIMNAGLHNGVEELPPWENVPRYYEHPHTSHNLRSF
jgi:hypothetical protein